MVDTPTLYEQKLLQKMAQMVGLQESIVELLQDAVLPLAKEEVKALVENPPTIEKQLVMCTEHPKYQGLRKPRSECPSCWELYEEKHK